MKNFIPFHFVFFLMLPFALLSQNFNDAEVESLATKIAKKIDAKNNLLKKNKRFNAILVEDFTDTEN